MTTTQGDPLLAEVYGDQATEVRVLVVDGHGLRIRVERGHLVLSDGIGSYRRDRRLSRANRTVRRIAVLGHSGHLTLEAIRWCADVGIHLAQVDTDGRVLAVGGPTGGDDARLRRAQALAGTTMAGVELARVLLRAKLHGQARVLATMLDAQPAADAVLGLAGELDSATDLGRCLDREAAAANIYFGIWSGSVQARFASRDAAAVPEHWLTFDARRSPLDAGRSPRKAADPVNAILNYAYALGEAECTIALRAVGLDSGLGVLHADKRNRDSLALDLLEVLRPEIETRVLTLLATRHFRRTDFHETSDGTCRILAPLTHQLAEVMPQYARLVAPYAETAARIFADAHPGVVVPRTPLTKAKSRAGQQPGRRRRSRTDTPPEQRPMPTCRVCGVELTERRRQLCATCWPVTRSQLAGERARKGVAARAARLAAGDPDPTTTEQAAIKRSAALSSAKATETAWRRANPDVVADPRVWATKILPRLAGVPLSRIQQATGLSVSACSKMRSGKLRPHVRHWAALAQIAAP